LTDINEQQETTIVLATHEPEDLGKWADLSLLMEGGALVAH